jgi:hypothetical protein
MESTAGFNSSKRYRNHLGEFLIVVESGITGAEEVRAEFLTVVSLISLCTLLMS